MVHLGVSFHVPSPGLLPPPSDRCDSPAWGRQSEIHKDIHCSSADIDMGRDQPDQLVSGPGYARRHNLLVRTTKGAEHIYLALSLEARNVGWGRDPRSDGIPGCLYHALGQSI